MSQSHFARRTRTARPLACAALAGAALALAAPPADAAEIDLTLKFESTVPITSAGVYAVASGTGFYNIDSPDAPADNTTDSDLNQADERGDPRNGPISASASVRLDGLNSLALWPTDENADEWDVLWRSSPPSSVQVVSARGSVSVSTYEVSVFTSDELLISRWKIPGEFGPSFSTTGKEFVGADASAVFTVYNEKASVSLKLTEFDVDYRYTIGRYNQNGASTVISDPATYVLIRNGKAAVARGMAGINDDAQVVAGGFMSVDANGEVVLTPGFGLTVDGGQEVQVLKEVAMPGDLDNDQAVTPADIDAIQAAAGTVVPGNVVYLPADANADGVVTVAPGGAQTDAEFVLQDVLGTKTADFNLDGVVDMADYTILSAGFGTATTWSGGDANFNGTVDIRDFLVLREQFD